jgi:tetratricopeptide (TPR) repeat protein
MLLTASNLGYTPSTLSAKRLKLTSSKRETDYPPSRRLDARFKQLLQIGSDPDVLTLQGFDWLRQGNDGSALRYFDRAIAAAAATASSVGTPQPAKDQAQSGQQNDNPAVREPRWFYEALCHQNRGLLLLQQGRKEEAIAAFRIVALELDLREGYLELAKLLPRGTPERETYLLKTAQAGNFEACHLLALDLADRANEPGLSQAEREEAAYMAQEWAWQVPNVGEGKGLLSTIAEKVKDIVRLRSDFAPYVDGHGESPVSIR